MDLDKVVEILNKIKTEYVWVPLIMVAVTIVLLLARFMLLPALSSSNKGATAVIHESEDGEYVRDILESLDE